MSHRKSELRPEVDQNMSRAEFERWYWPVSELTKFCEHLGVSKSGRKADLRERVSLALDGCKSALSAAIDAGNQDGFNWKREVLSLDTRITDSIKFGPNVRSFFKSQIGAKFVCHSDFMDWVKTNSGRTLQDAIYAWHVLEERRNDTRFRREIAECNNYLQYLRDIRDDNPNMSLDDAKRCWDQKKVRPAKDGVVVYEEEDLRLIDAT